MSGPRTTNRVLAAGALVLGALAPLAGSPFGSGAALERDGAARVGAVELASWLRARGTVRVYDLRDSLAFEDFHLPTARRSSAAALERLALTPADTLVLYGDEADVARAFAALASGPASVRYMVDGVGEWLSEIMNPMLAPDASAEDRAAFARVAELSRYFGGLPRIGVPSEPADRAGLLERTRRRGCAF